jgi:hypothetical protein
MSKRGRKGYPVQDRTAGYEITVPLRHVNYVEIERSWHFHPKS